MTSTQKRLALALLIATLLGIIALAAAVPRLEFKPGSFFRVEAAAEGSPEAQIFADASGMQRGLLLLRAVVAALVLIYPIYLLFSLFSKEGRRRLLKDLARLAVLVLFLVWFSSNSSQYLQGLQPGEEAASASEIELTPVATLVAFDPGNPGGSARTLLIVGVLVLGVIAAAVAWWWFEPTRRKTLPPPSPRDQLAAEAAQAAQAIESGEELSNVILRCYHQMERILAEGRGLARPDANTPAEFAAALVAQGLPAAPVQQLTRLFEAARYGSLETTYDAQQAAVKCLTAIQRTVAFGL